MPLGSPVVPDEYSTHSGWSKGTGVNSSGAAAAVSSAHGTVPSSVASGSRCGTSTVAFSVGSAFCRPATRSRTSNASAVVAVAVDRDQHRGLDLGEAVEHRAGAEVRRARRPHRAQRGRGQEGHQRLDRVRDQRDDPVAAPDPGRRQSGAGAGDEVAQLRVRDDLLGPVLDDRDGGDVVVLPARDRA